MEKLFNAAIILLVIIYFISCRKDKQGEFDGVNCTGKCFILTGKIIDSAANSPLSNAEIKFFFKNLPGSIFNTKSYLGRAITDGNGNYRFTFDGTNYTQEFGYFYAEVYKDNLFYDPFYGNRVASFNLDSTLYNIPLVQNFAMFRPATLKIRVIAATLTNFQSLTISYSYGRIGNGIVLNGGRQIDTTLTYKTAGDIRTIVQSEARGNGVNITKADTVVVNANSSKQIEIRF